MIPKLSEMRSGRPPSWLLDETENRVRQDARLLDKRGRFTIPPRLLDGFPGVDQSGCGLVLVEARHSGCVVLRSWESDGKAVLARRDELKESLEDIRALDDVFRRGRIEPGGRFELHLPLLGHLDASFRIKGVFLARYPDRIEICSRNYRAKLLKDLLDMDFD